MRSSALSDCPYFILFSLVFFLFHYSGQLSVPLVPRCSLPDCCKLHSVHIALAGTSAGFWLGGRGVNVPLPPEAIFFSRKFDYEMVQSEVYLNKYVVSIAPFSTLTCPDCSQNNNMRIIMSSEIQKLLFLHCMFSLLKFSSIFPGGQLTPFAPMCGRPLLLGKQEAQLSPRDRAMRRVN